MSDDALARLRALEDKFTTIMVHLATIQSDMSQVKSVLSGQSQFRKGAGKLVLGAVSTVVTALAGSYLISRFRIR